VKLATLKSGTRDGRLVVVAPDHATGALVPDIPTLLRALEDWQGAEPRLREVAEALARGSGGETVDLRQAEFMAPLPRTWAWLDGSAFLHHVILVRKARGAEPPEDLWTVPLMYQGVSDTFLGPRDDIPLLDEAHGMDFEAEVGVVVDDVPMGVPAAEAGKHIKLLVLMNDVSLRNLIPRELAAGFGFFQGKPASSFGPYAVTPDEAGEAWRDGRLHLEMRSELNGRLFGHPHAGAMHFSFGDLIAHAARTRALSAGTIIGSGTVSNEDETVGSSCLAEQRMIEKIKTGAMTTPFMKAGDTISIEMLQGDRSLFGRIAQRVVAHRPVAPV
jgi:fumarylacetoacetate (FAA) hydrolase